MHAQVLQVALRDQLAHCIGHGADAQLQAAAVRDFIHDERCDLPVHIADLWLRNAEQGPVVGFHDEVHLRDVDSLVPAAAAVGHIRVHLDDDGLCPVGDMFGYGIGWSEVEVSVGIHGRHLHHEYVRIYDPIKGRALVVEERDVVAQALVVQASVASAEVPVVIREVVLAGSTAAMATVPGKVSARTLTSRSSEALLASAASR